MLRITYANVNPDGTLANGMGGVEVNGHIYQSQPDGGCSVDGCNCSPGHWITFILPRAKNGDVVMLKVSFDSKEAIEVFRGHDFKGNPIDIAVSDVSNPRFIDTCNWENIVQSAKVTDSNGSIFYFYEDGYGGFSKENKGEGIQDGDS